ncbi:MAG: lanthionine synthetase C family protein [Polyangiaceae bacterium]
MGLGQGLADRAIFYAWRGVTFADDAATARAQGLLHRLVEAAENASDELWLLRGCAGIGWTIAHLSDRQSADLALSTIDATILGTLEQRPWRFDYDLISGLVGLGVYALARVPGRPAQRMLGRILDPREAAALRTSAGHTWHTPPSHLPAWQRELAPDGYFNYGLAHGVPGVIALLAAMIEAGEHEARARALLEPAVSWLLEGELAPGIYARFPMWVSGVAPPPLTRAAWCYGDPGVAIALARAARATGSAATGEAAARIARTVALRDETNAGIVDPAICHGAFGLAHVLRRLSSFVPDPDLERAAMDWTRRGLAMRRAGEAFGGFRFHSADTDVPDEHALMSASTLLAGSPGIGLVLLSMLDDECDGWDAPLLTDL